LRMEGGVPVAGLVIAAAKPAFLRARPN
jgi:hypothetical protein